jgi:pyruvate-formate lyase
MVDRETLIAAKDSSADCPNVMVRVAGYSARFIDLGSEEQEKLINRTTQWVG